MSYVKGHYRNTSNGRIWVSGHSRKLGGFPSGGNGIGFFAFVAIAIVFVVIKFIISNKGVVLVIVLPVAAIIIMCLVIENRKKRKIYNFQENMNKYILMLNDGNESDLKDIIGSIAILNTSLMKMHQKTDLDIINGYRQLLSRFIKDAHISNSEYDIMNLYESTFQLDISDVKTTKRDAFLLVYEWAINDRQLSDIEEELLRDLFAKLSLDPEDFTSETNFLSQLSEARNLVNKELEKKETPFTLQENEKCYFSTDSRFYKAKQVNWKFHPQLEREGRLYISNMHLIFDDPRYFKIKLSDMDDISVFDDKYIIFYDKNKVKPYYVYTQKPYVTKVILSNCKNLDSSSISFQEDVKK